MDMAENDFPRVQQPVFVVRCERISKRLAYYVSFPINNQLVERIKALPEETRKWSGLVRAWEITTPSLFALIKQYKGSNKIHFDFGTEDSRKVFIAQIKKIEIAEAEKRKFIADLNVKKEHWVQYKKELSRVKELKEAVQDAVKISKESELLMMEYLLYILSEYGLIDWKIIRGSSRFQDYLFSALKGLG